MIRTILSVALMTFGCFEILMAQSVVSGYLGSRNYVTIGFEGGGSHHPQKPVIAGNELYRYYSSQDLIVTAGRAIKKHWVAELHFTRVRTSLNFDRTDWLDDEPLVEHESRSFFVDRVLGTPDIRANQFLINFKYYRPKFGALAPLGIYIGLGAGPSFIRANFTEVIAQELFTQNPMSLGMKEFYPEKSYFMFNYQFSMGSTRALTKNIVLDVGTSLNWATPLSYPEQSGPPLFTDEVDKLVYRRIRMLALPNIYVSMGYLF